MPTAVSTAKGIFNVPEHMVQSKENFKFMFTAVKVHTQPCAHEGVLDSTSKAEGMKRGNTHILLK